MEPGLKKSGLSAWIGAGWGALSRMYSHIQLASKLSSGCDYALFKVSSAHPPPQATGGLILLSSASAFLPHGEFGGGVPQTAFLRAKVGLPI